MIRAYVLRVVTYPEVKSHILRFILPKRDITPPAFEELIANDNAAPWGAVSVLSVCQVRDGALMVAHPFIWSESWVGEYKDAIKDYVLHKHESIVDTGPVRALVDHEARRIIWIELSSYTTSLTVRDWVSWDEAWAGRSGVRD